MPPMEYLKEFKDYLPNIFRPSQPDGPDAGSQERHEQELPSRVDGSEDMEPGGVNSNKRVRDSSDQHMPPNKKLRRPGDDEYRLTGIGGGHAPVKGTPITMPTNPSPEPEVIVEQKKPKGRKIGGGFRMQNTLGNTQAGKANRAGNLNNPPYKSPAKRVKEAAAQNEGQIKVPLTNAYVGDGFTQDNGRSKRRKTAASPPSKDQEYVEVSSDEEPAKVPRGSVQAVNGVPYQNDDSSEDRRSAIVVIDSQSQPKSGPSKYFGAPEARKVNSYTDTRRPRAPRRGSSNQRTPSLASNQYKESQRPASSQNNDPSGIDDLASPSRLTGRNAPASSNTIESKKSRPPINLDEGMDDIQRRKEDRDMHAVNGTLSGLYKKQINPKPLIEPTANRQMRTTAAESEESPLRRQFRRDGSATTQHQREEQPRRPSLVRSMKSTSHSEKRNSCDESPDQLWGDTTVTSRKNTSERSSRQRSPSDLRSTKFTKSNSKETNGRSAQSAGGPESRSDDGELRIPMNQIVSRGCVLRKTSPDDTIDLVWQDDQFQVEHNGKPYRVPHKNQIMAVAGHELNNWLHAKGSPKVILKGSMTDRSNGHILLCFAHIAGKDECHLYLFAASKNTMRITTLEPDHLDKMYNRQEKEVQLDSTKRVQKAKAELAEQQRQQTTKPTAGEDIVYEESDETVERPAPIRTRMQDAPKDGFLQPRKPHFFDAPTTRKSSRQSKPVAYKSPTPPPEEPDYPKWTKIHKPEPWKQPVVYPEQGARRATVDFQDLERLDEGEYLNDSVVGYALRRIEESMAPEHKNKVHFFNSFFYTSLTNKNGRVGLNYDAIKKWIKSKDLFEIPYVVVPINENLHWYVAIICNLPELARKPVEVGDDGADDVATSPQPQKASAPVSPIRDPFVPDSQEAETSDKEQAEKLSKLSLGDGGVSSKSDSETFEFGEDGKVTKSTPNAQDEDLPSQPTGSAPAKEGKKGKKRAAPPLKKYPVDRPTIITLDSLNIPHAGPVSFLKDYVSAEAHAKRGMTVRREDIQGMKAVGIPVQSNFCDCGLFLVGYVEEFAKDPQAFINKVLTRQLDQESDFASFNPSQKRDQLRDDLIGLHAEQNAAKQEQKKAKKMDKIAAAAGTTDQASVAPVTAKACPAEVQAPTAQSSKAASPARAPSPKVLLPPSEDAEAGHHSGLPGSRPDDMIPNNADTSAVSQVVRPVDEIGDSQDLETAVPRALVNNKSGGASRTPEEHEPNRGTKSATTSGEDEEHEMLDSAALGEVESQQLRHKVCSPEIDSLSTALQDHQRSARASRTTSPDKRS